LQKIGEKFSGRDRLWPMGWFDELLRVGSPLDYGLFAIGWVLGWLLLAQPRHLPTASQGHTPPVTRPAVCVVVPARDEAEQLPHLVPPLVAQQRLGDRVVVVDDHSSDGTGDVARQVGADVLVPPALPGGWRGKPHACHVGAASGTEPILLFADADVRPSATLLDDIAAEVERYPEHVVSVQPWHTMPTSGEQLSLLSNVTALMGCGAFTPVGDRTSATVAFGPVLAMRRDLYERIGGHAEPTIRTMHTEDIGLARAAGRSRLYVGSPASTTFRMYPGGLRELIAGWTRSVASGARFTNPLLALAVLGWVWSLAGGWLTAPIVYPLSALQLWVLGRRAGTTRWWAAVAYPLLVVVFTVIFIRSLLVLLLRRDVTWKRRSIPSRSG